MPQSEGEAARSPLLPIGRSGPLRSARLVKDTLDSTGVCNADTTARETPRANASVVPPVRSRPPRVPQASASSTQDLTTGSAQSKGGSLLMPKGRSGPSRSGSARFEHDGEASTEWTRVPALPKSRENSSFVPQVQTRPAKLLGVSTNSAEDSTTVIARSASAMLPLGTGENCGVASHSDAIGVGQRFVAVSPSVTALPRNSSTAMMSSRALVSSDTSASVETPIVVKARPSHSSGRGLHAETSIVVKARPSHSSGRGLHAYLGGKDPFDVLGELADEIDIATTSALGKGHFGEVKQARRKRDGLTVAVKMIPMKEIGPSVRREVQAMHDMERHPNLIQLVDVYACRKPLQAAEYDGPYICIVTEFIEAAEPLSQRIAARGPQPSLASPIVLQLAEALAVVHQRGYVHRDVWPENILLKSNGSVVLVDFGTAVRYDAGEFVMDKLNIPYVAPETSHRARQGPAEDCWAVGLVLSEIVTGQLLRDRIGAKAIPAYSQTRVMNEVRTETAAIGGRVLGKLCVDLLNFDPASRTSMKDVRAYLSGPTSPAKSSSMSQASTQEPTPESTPRVPLAPRVTRMVSCQSDFLKSSLPDTCPDTSVKIQRGNGTNTGLETSVKIQRGNGQTVARDMTARDLVGNLANLETGARVAYIARSNGVSYSGVVEGRSVDGKGLHLILDCGTSKLVPEDDAWRISKIA